MKGLRKTYLIEKGISIPNATTKYPFADMVEGDSFFYPHNEDQRAGGSHALSSAAKAFLTRHPDTHGHLRCVTRKVEGGFRIWFVAKVHRGEIISGRDTEEAF